MASLTVRNAALDGRSYGESHGHRRDQAAPADADGHRYLGRRSDSRQRRMAHGGRLSRRSAHRQSRASRSPRCTISRPANTSARIFPSAVSSKATPPSPVRSIDLPPIKADVTLSTVQLNASPNVASGGGVQLQDLVLQNAQPLHIVATGNSIDFGHASFIAKDTTLDASADAWRSIRRIRGICPSKAGSISRFFSSSTRTCSARAHPSSTSRSMDLSPSRKWKAGWN